MYDQNELSSLGNQIFFAAISQKYGAELHAGTISPAAVYFTSIKNGNWDDPSIWLGSVVPPASANVVIKHFITGNVNAVCNSLDIQTPGSLNVLAGINIKVLH